MAALVAWGTAALAAQAILLRSRGRGEVAALVGRRRAQPLVAAEHVALALALATGALLLLHHGWGLGHARWLGLKLGLVAFLVLPLEGMHAWVSHGWIARGLRQGGDLATNKDLRRGIGMDDMLRTLGGFLLGVAVPLLVWLSVRKPW